MISPDEQLLISRLKQGHSSALETIFHQYHARLCQLSYRFSNDRELAKDIVQEVFVKVWNNREVLHITVSLQAYLKRAVINTTLNAIESQNRSRKSPLDEKLELETTQTASAIHDLSELEQRAQQAIEDLPLRTKTVFKLIRLEDMSYREVAQTLTISEKAVEKEMMKALRLLRIALRDYLPLMAAAIIFF